MIAILAHIPWLLWLIDCSIRESRPARREGARLGIALLTGSQILLGYPGAVVISGLIEGFHVLHVSRQERVFAPLLWLVGAKLLGVLIGCIQLLPTVEAFLLSVRADTGIALGLGRLPSLTHFGASLARPAVAFVGALLALVCVALFARAARGDRLALIAIAVFAAADVSWFCGSLWWNDPPRDCAEFPATVPHSPAVLPARTAIGYTVYLSRDDQGKYSFLTSTRFILHDARLVSGYVGLSPERKLHPYDHNPMRVAGVTTWLLDGVFRPFSSPLPLFRLVNEAVVSADPAAAIETIDVARTAAVDRPVELFGGSAGEVEVVEYLPGSIQLRTISETRQLLVISESFHPGWKLQVDGEQAPLVRT